MCVCVKRVGVVGEKERSGGQKKTFRGLCGGRSGAPKRQPPTTMWLKNVLLWWLLLRLRPHFEVFFVGWFGKRGPMASFGCYDNQHYWLHIPSAHDSSISLFFAPKMPRHLTLLGRNGGSLGDNIPGFSTLGGMEEKFCGGRQGVPQQPINFYTKTIP